MIAKLKIENFLSIKDIEIDNMQEMDTIGISGQYKDQIGYSNGSGKSSLAESILYAFTGKHRYKKDIDVVRIGERQAYINLEYHHKKDIITIEKFIKIKKNDSGTSTSTLVKKNKEITASQTVEAQNWINNYFGVNPDGFIKSFYFRQKEYDKLLKVRPAERLKFIEDFLGASIFDKAKKLSSKRRNELDYEIKGIDIQIETLKEEIEDIDEDRLKEELKTHRKKLKTFEAELKNNELVKDETRKEMIQLEGKIDLLEKSVEERDVLEKNIQNIRQKGKALEIKKKKLDTTVKTSKKKIKEIKDKLLTYKKTETESLDEQLDSAKDKRENTLIEVASETARKDSFEEAFSKVEVGDCPICERQIDEKLIKSLERKSSIKIIPIKKRIAEKKTKLIKLDSEIDSLKKELKEAKDNNEKIKNIKQRLKTQEIELKADEKVVEAFADQITALKKQLKTNTVKLNKLKEDEEEGIEEKFEELQNEMDVLIKDIQTSNHSIKTTSEAINTTQAQINGVIEKEKNVSVLTKKRKFRTLEIRNRIKLDSVFDKCRMEIISVGLEELENDSTQIIGEIGATQKEIVWESQKESLKGNLKDSLDIYLIDEKGKRAVEGLSGGEFDTAAFATRAALARYKLSRMKSKIDFMVLDEVFGALDDNSKEELITVINMFKEEFSQVFVISHTNLKESFGNNIKVEMGSDGITRLV